jgi:hypothetical protein
MFLPHVPPSCHVCHVCAGCYVEYFQHRQGQPPQYSVSPLRLLANRPLRRHWPDTPLKPSQRLAFQHAQQELDEIQRIREVRQIDRPID